MINVNKLFGEKRISDGQCIIYSIDSDVSLLAVHHFSYYENIIHMWVETGRSDLTKKTSTHRFVPTHHICQRLDPGLSEVLPAVAALTGGDEVSSFHFKGKKSTMKLIKKTKKSKPGPHPNLPLFLNLAVFTHGSIEECVNAARPLIALLYDPARKYKKQHSDLNELRTQMSVTTNEPLSKLPPCEPEFLQHVKRAVKQHRDWVNARNPPPTPPIDPPGWEHTPLGLVPIMFEGPTSAELVEGLYCEDCKECDTCSCFSNGLPCIDLCSCSGDMDKCHNEKTLFSVPEDAD